jgi:hypothetical protein
MQSEVARSRSAFSVSTDHVAPARNMHCAAQAYRQRVLSPCPLSHAYVDLSADPMLT